jgi:hypothetical protein
MRYWLRDQESMPSHLSELTEQLLRLDTEDAPSIAPTNEEPVPGLKAPLRALATYDPLYC